MQFSIPLIKHISTFFFCLLAHNPTPFPSHAPINKHTRAHADTDRVYGADVGVL